MKIISSKSSHQVKRIEIIKINSVERTYQEEIINSRPIKVWSSVRTVLLNLVTWMGVTYKIVRCLTMTMIQRWISQVTTLSMIHSLKRRSCKSSRTYRMMIASLITIVITQKVCNYRRVSKWMQATERVLKILKRLYRDRKTDSITLMSPIIAILIWIIRATLHLWDNLKLFPLATGLL